MAKQGINIYKDGAIVRIKNRRISFRQNEDHVYIKFSFAGDEEPEKAACSHKCIKGKVRQTNISMSNEAMESLVFAYLHYKKSKIQNK